MIALPTAETPILEHSVDTCAHTGQKRGECACSHCIRAYRRITAEVNRRNLLAPPLMPSTLADALDAENGAFILTRMETERP